MRTVYHAQSLVDAHLVKDALDYARIPAFVTGEQLIGGVGQLPARDFIRVNVPDSCVEAARPVVREVEHQLAEARKALADEGDWDGDTLTAPG